MRIATWWSGLGLCQVAVSGLSSTWTNFLVLSLPMSFVLVLPPTPLIRCQIYHFPFGVIFVHLSSIPLLALSNFLSPSSVTSQTHLAELYRVFPECLTSLTQPRNCIVARVFGGIRELDVQNFFSPERMRYSFRVRVLGRRGILLAVEIYLGIVGSRRWFRRGRDGCRPFNHDGQHLLGLPLSAIFA